MAYAGKCACGLVTATITGEPVATRECWCRQCQQVAGGGATRNAIFRTADFELIGTTAAHSYTAASGNTLTQHFCPDCGTPVYGESSARPHLRTARFGFLEPGHGLRPEAVIWTQDAPAWAVVDPALEQFERQSPPPQSPPLQSPPSSSTTSS